MIRFITNLFKKKERIFPKPKFNIGDIVMWNNFFLYVNDYYFTENNEMCYILYHPGMRMFYEDVEENEIVRL